MALDTCAAARSRTELSRGGIEYELSFWDKWMASRGGKWASDFLQRLDPSSPFRFQKELATTRAPNQTHFTVLDVGSGPLPKCGRELTQTKLFAARSTLEVIAVDPLAKDSIGCYGCTRSCRRRARGTLTASDCASISTTTFLTLSTRSIRSTTHASPCMCCSRCSRSSGAAAL